MSKKALAYIRAYRKQKGISQKQIARLLGETQQYYSKIEKGTIPLPFNLVFTIAQCLEIDVLKLMREILYGAENTDPSLAELPVSDPLYARNYFQSSSRSSHTAFARYHHGEPSLDFRQEIPPLPPSHTIQHFHPQVPRERTKNLELLIFMLQQELAMTHHQQPQSLERRQ